MPAPKTEARAEAVALFSQGGLSVKQIAEQVGADKRSVKRWKRAWKDEGNKPSNGPSKSTPSKPATAPQQSQKIEEPEGPGDDDDPVSYWLTWRRRAETREDEATRNKHTSAATQWARIAHHCQGELQKARAAAAEEEDRKRRAMQRDPRDLARRLLRQLPVLLRAVPDMVPEVRAQIDAIVPRE